MSKQSFATIIFKDTFEDTSLWDLVSDNVMGGVSIGNVFFEPEDEKNTAILSGTVSTDNKGGFIQIRRTIQKLELDTANYIRIIAKGNNQKYYIHLRTSSMIFPWQYYQAHFFVRDNFNSFEIPISVFQRSGFLLSKTVKPESIISIAIVAFGRNHSAEIHVKEISFLRL